ncbi:MAG: CSLREA domain-containing protein [Chloroflexi bacterium]|nr:MAG: CSLREA domain-containing protein [Chloroflexota bacterium]
MTQTQLNHKTLRTPGFRAWLGVLFGTLVIVSALIMSPSSAPAANAGINGSTAANITVNTFADEDTDNASCSLREAIKAANNDTAYQGCSAGSGADVIGVPAGTYTLSDQLPFVNSTITIQGNNAIVQADANPNTATYRIFEVSGAGDLTINHLILENGNCPNSLGCSNSTGNQEQDKGMGGAIINAGILTVNDSRIKNNTSASTGGGIFLRQGTLTVLNTVFENNTAASGGGIGTGGSGSISVTDSTFSGNSASSGGGISSGSSNNPVNVTGSTFSGNSAGSGFGGGIGSSGNLDVRTSTFLSNTAGSGAGISSSYGGNASIVGNSTFSGNTATSKGGGIYNDADLTLTNNTFSLNSAPTGGGFYNDPYKQENENIYPVVNLKNTLLANSTSGDDCYNYVNGAVKPVLGNNNLIESDSAGNNACGTTDPINNSDPLLGTMTGSPAFYPLLTGSPAINAGNDSDCAAAPVNNASQNGVTRPKSTHCDIGSYEANVAGTPTAYVVNSNADHDDGVCDVFGTGTGFQDCTLREAITLANANIAPDTITFSLSTVITLGAPLPAIDDDVTIDGAGNTPAPTIDGANAYQVFTVNNGKTLNLSLESRCVIDETKRRYERGRQAI